MLPPLPPNSRPVKIESTIIVARPAVTRHRRANARMKITGNTRILARSPRDLIVKIKGGAR